MPATADRPWWQREVCIAAWFTLAIWGGGLVHLWPMMILTWPLTHPNQHTGITGCPGHRGEPQHSMHRMAAACPPHLRLNIAGLLVSWFGQGGLGLNSCPGAGPPDVTLFLLQNTTGLFTAWMMYYQELLALDKALI